MIVPPFVSEVEDIIKSTLRDAKTCVSAYRDDSLIFVSTDEDHELLRVKVYHKNPKVEVWALVGSSHQAFEVEGSEVARLDYLKQRLPRVWREENWKLSDLLEQRS